MFYLDHFSLLSRSNSQHSPLPKPTLHQNIMLFNSSLMVSFHLPPLSPSIQSTLYHLHSNPNRNSVETTIHRLEITRKSAFSTGKTHVAVSLSNWKWQAQRVTIRTISEKEEWRIYSSVRADSTRSNVKGDKKKDFDPTSFGMSFTVSFDQISIKFQVLC